MARLPPNAPSGAEPADGYRYDPAHPVPFITEPTSNQIGGPDDYSAIERRDDVLVYMTAALAGSLEVTGPIRVDLYASSSAPDTDFMAKLVDIWPNGFAQRLCDGMVRARFRDGMANPSLIEPGHDLSLLHRLLEHVAALQVRAIASGWRSVPAPSRSMIGI